MDTRILQKAKNKTCWSPTGESKQVQGGEMDDEERGRRKSRVFLPSGEARVGRTAGIIVGQAPVLTIHVTTIKQGKDTSVIIRQQCSLMTLCVSWTRREREREKIAGATHTGPVYVPALRFATSFNIELSRYEQVHVRGGQSRELFLVFVWTFLKCDLGRRPKQFCFQLSLFLRPHLSFRWSLAPLWPAP